ncbi:MAG TPA: S8 family serine peptidase [Candidatus Acidoferrales bacterium]|nr:S8 family serine peptidase [Candidatus Acidoferrales bacterium]
MKKLVLLGLCAVLVCLALVGSSRAQRPTATFPVIVVFSDTASFEHFRGQYRPDDRAAADPDAWDYLDHAVAGAAQAFERQMGFRADHVFSAAIRGFSARVTAVQIQALERNPLVSYVEADGEMSISTQVLPWGINRINADISSTLAGNGSGSVSNVHVYIIDTGSDATHPDLNVINHVNFANGPNKDCNGHGTHVSGTVAARDNTIDVVGVAPGAPITGVKVLGCGGSGTTSGVIKGVDWVTANAIKPAIANMSLGGGASSALDNAVINSANSGVFYSLAAGNSSANACNSSPARAGTTNGVMTVAATDSADREASFSNFGPCVDLWAPGVSVLSTKNGGGTTTLSGTSMASPHAGGTGALYLSSHPGATAATVESALKSASVATGTNSKDGRAIKLVYAGTF